VPLTKDNLWAPYSFVNATPTEIKMRTNGCGAAGARFDFVPDTIWGLSIERACRIHDWMYGRGRTIEDKNEADRVFFNNMLRLIEASTSNRLLRFLRRRRALAYYKAVCWFGGPAFWAGKPDAPGSAV